MGPYIYGPKFRWNLDKEIYRRISITRACTGADTDLLVAVISKATVPNLAELTH